MSVKANKDKDSILADAKELLKILIPAIQTMPKIERIDGAATDMKRAAFDMIHHFTIAYNCSEVRAENIHQMFGDYGRLIACFEILLTQQRIANAERRHSSGSCISNLRNPYLPNLKALAHP